MIIQKLYQALHKGRMEEEDVAPNAPTLNPPMLCTAVKFMM